MWILAIPIGVLSLIGAYRAARIVVALLRRSRLSAKSEQIGYGVVVISTAFMVVPWLVPPVGIFRGVVALLYIGYVYLGMEQIYRAYKATRRAAELTAITVTSVTVGVDPDIFANALITVAALVASQSPEVGSKVSSTLIRVESLAKPSKNLNLSTLFESLNADANDAFGKVALLQDLKTVRNTEVSQKVSQFAHELAQSSNSDTSVLSEIDEALGVN